METRYIKDENTGLTIRLDESSDETGVHLSCQVANELRVERGEVVALPFEIPKSEREKELDERIARLFKAVGDGDRAS
jgi:hypothetical protein